ncbi:MAG: PilZ domain-containing protein [Pseudomonadota bacterium]
MVTERRIQRHQLTYFLAVFNRLTDKPLGYLGNVSEQGLMLISQLPLLVGASFELRLKVPGADGRLQFIDLTAVCRWCHEDVTPHFYDAGFTLYQPPAEYAALITALREYFSFHPLQASA